MIDATQIFTCIISLIIFFYKKDFEKFSLMKKFIVFLKKIIAIFFYKMDFEKNDATNLLLAGKHDHDCGK